MEIKKIRLKNFRGFDDAEITFGRVNHIFGDNDEGKSSLAEGITFALCGTTIYGSSSGLDALIKDNGDLAEVALTTLVNGTERVVQRNIKIVRKTGKPEKTETEVFLDGIKTTQPQIQEKLLGRLDSNQFLMGFAPLFYDTLDTAKLRKIIVSLAIPPSRKEVLEQLTEAEREMLGDEAILDQTKLKKELDDLEKKRDGLTAQVELLKKQLAEKPSSEISPEGTGETEDKLVVLQNLKDKLAALQVQKENLSKSIGSPPTAPAYADTAAIGDQLKQLRKKVMEIKVPAFKVGDKCPTCGQAVVASALKQLQDSVSAQRNEIIASGQALKATLEAAEKKNTAAKEKHDKAFTAWQAKQTELTNLNNEITTLSKQVSDSAVSDHKEKDRQKLEAALLEKEKAITDMNKDMSERREVIGSLNAYRLKMIEMQTANLSKYLDRVSIKLFETVKSTGESSETFKLLYDNKPQQFLSFSQKMRVGLELGQMFRELSGVKIPYFLDNAESIGRPPQFDVQVFYAWFVLGNKLEVRDPEDNKISAEIDAVTEGVSLEERIAS